ncbi:MAG TPA: maleylpyruvate isomerase family mycothiol-dependent enzyme [Acidimicrobiales bacterium]|nr:maleylpyruvate isomerase family mycothiol-dependent enzyme [Acidimicrobiales bacterium]
MSRTSDDLLQELRFALAEADSTPPSDDARRRVLDHALANRAAGRSARVPPEIGGDEAFSRSVAQMDELLGDLEVSDWGRMALRGLSVQGLIGHLIGVERAFIEVLRGHPDATPPGGHVGTTQPTAEAQSDRLPEETLRDWRTTTGTTLALLRAEPGQDPRLPTRIAFYGIELPLQQLLVVRAFEMWIHHEDIRRATGRGPSSPDEATLSKMTELAVTLLPAALELAGAVRAQESAAVHLVLTGPGGGTWDVPANGAMSQRAGEGGLRRAASVVVDAADFCRVVGNRSNLATSGARIGAGEPMVAELFAAAAGLALD